MNKPHCPILDELSVIWNQKLSERYGEGYFLINEAVGRLKLIAERFYALGLNDNHFTKEILSKIPYKYEQRMSEILFSDRLIRDGYKLSSGKKGPDFKAEKNGKITWFEVITPQPVPKLVEQFNNPSYSLNPTHEGTQLATHSTLLKTTAAIEAKHHKIKGYINEGIISETDKAVIVINDSLFFPLDRRTIGLNCEVANGCSGLPLVAEGLLGIGQSYFTDIHKDNNFQIVRSKNETITNQNNSQVDTNRFETDFYSDISGVFVLTLREDYGLAEVVYEHEKNKKNKGVFLINPNTTRPFETGGLSAKYLDFKKLDNLTSASTTNPVRQIVTPTLWGYFMEFNRYISYIKQLYIEAGVFVIDEETDEVSLSEKAFEVGIERYVLIYDESTGIPKGVSLTEE